MNTNSQPTKPDQPSVLIFFVDQLSAKWLEATESGIVPLPNLKRFKQAGITFTNTITSNPVCCPARATVATGLTSRGHGVLENGYQLDPALPTFMQVLQNAGWRTGVFGKVHFHPHYAGLYPDYKPYGFDITHITEDPRGGEWLDWVQRTHPEHYNSALATVWPRFIPEFAAYGPDKVNLRDRIHSLRATFDWTTPEFPENTHEAYSLPFPEEVSQTAWITRHALEFLRETPPLQPFLAQVSYVQPHNPYCAPGEYLRRINPATLPVPVAAEWMVDPHAPAYFRGKRPYDGNWQQARRCYFADLVHLDNQLGLLLNELDQLGRAESTYVILLADHGDLLYDHGFRGKQERHYDACIRVPLVICGPGLERGKSCAAMVQLEDICPTVLDMTGQSMPNLPKEDTYLKVRAGDIPQLPGHSLLQLCRREPPVEWRQAAYCESYNDLWSIDSGDWARTIRTTQYRYTLYPRGNGEQMFDLRGDPDEQTNLVACPRYANIRQELRDRLLELIILQDYPKTRRQLFALGVH